MLYRYKSVYLEGLEISLPPQIVSSEEIEQKLAPLYERLGFSAGRLELMTGIQARRFGEPGLRPSDLCVEAGKKVLAETNMDVDSIGCLVHTAVCRDFIEPATATVIHHKLGLSRHCQAFDISNACLGWLNGIFLVANMIELGQIEAGLVVSGEDGRALVETTIHQLNQNIACTRQTLKPSFASLTIGSGGVAALITSKEWASSSHQILGVATQSATQHHGLCQGGFTLHDHTCTSVTMNTDSETLLHAGIGLASQTWAKTKKLLGWNEQDIDHYITHQVGTAHRRLLYEKLELNLEKDFSTFAQLGNVGSASVGITLASANLEGRLQEGDNILLMGIGSGLVSMMMGLRW